MGIIAVSRFVMSSAFIQIIESFWSNLIKNGERSPSHGLLSIPTRIYPPSGVWASSRTISRYDNSIFLEKFEPCTMLINIRIKIINLKCFMFPPFLFFDYNFCSPRLILNNFSYNPLFVVFSKNFSIINALFPHPGNAATFPVATIAIELIVDYPVSLSVDELFAVGGAICVLSSITGNIANIDIFYTFLERYLPCHVEGFDRGGGSVV